MIKGADGETNDTLTVDFSGGLILPDGIRFDGGTGGFDMLELTGGSARNEVYEARNANDGTITIDNLTIVYSNIEPITDTVPSATLTVNATAAAETINIVDGGPLTDGNCPGGCATTQVNSGASGTFESVTFANKTTATINGVAGADTITINNPTPATGLTRVRVNGGANPGTIVNIPNTPASVIELRRNCAHHHYRG